MHPDITRQSAPAGPPSRLRQMLDDPALYRQACAEARRTAPQRFPHLFRPRPAAPAMVTEVVIGIGATARMRSRSSEGRADPRRCRSC